MKKYIICYFKTKPIIIDIIDTLAIIGLTLIVITSLVLQVTLSELPCPLCLLQRLGLLMMALSLTWILLFGKHSRHYGMALTASLFTGVVSVRQVLLHIVPGTGSYGQALFGLSLYAWTVVIVFCVLCYVAFILTFGINNRQRKQTTKFASFIAWTLFIVIVITTVMVGLQCGIENCPDDPIAYQWL